MFRISLPATDLDGKANSQANPRSVFGFPVGGLATSLARPLSSPPTGSHLISIRVKGGT